MPTHFDIVVVIAVCFGIGLAGLAAVGWMAWDIHTSMKKSLEEGRRTPRALAGLVVQESEKIRNLMSD